MFAGLAFVVLAGLFFIPFLIQLVRVGESSAYVEDYRREEDPPNSSEVHS